MHSRPRPALLLALVAALSLPVTAHANQAYDEVSNAFSRTGGHLDPCAFTQAELEAAIKGIPPRFRDAIPTLSKSMEDGIAAHERGDCKGIKPDEGTTGGATPGHTPTTTVPPVTTPPVATQTAPVVPSAAAPTTPTTATAPPPAAAQPASATAHERDRTPLVIALIAAGTLVLLGLLLWALARMRGWDPPWVARMRHGWGEAGLRTTSTWAEFTDWLRLGR